MGWRIDWLEVARDDLREIVEFIAEDNSEKAIEEGSHIIEKIEDLERFPDRGSKFTDYDYPELYQLVESHYRIIYHLKLDREIVEVWRIWHGARGDVIIQNPNG